MRLSLLLRSFVPSFRLSGQIDQVGDRVVRGWAWSPGLPRRRRLQLDVFHKDLYLGRVSTGQFRSDLLGHGVGDGRHGFLFHLPPDVPADLDLKDLCVATAGPERRALAGCADLVTAAGRNRVLPASHRHVLGPYLASLRNAPTGRPTGRPRGPRPHVDALCAPVDATGLSAFVDHIARKHERLELETGDEAALWRWYLGTYAMERGAQRLAPLSRDDIRRLTRRSRDGESSVVETFADELGRDRAYRWAIEASHRLGVEDCLVGAETAAALQAPRTRVAFPLSTFMRAMRRETAILRRLPIRTESERRAIYALLLILGLRTPHLLAYLPRDWLLRLLGEPGLFEATLAGLFDGESAMSGDRYVAIAAAGGFDVAAQAYASRRYNGHRILGGPHVATADRPVDVQIFGPLGRRLGLGESCRRVADALEATPFSVNVVDYDIGNTSQADTPAKVRAGAPRAARLNILHLNAEEIPEAVAFLPDVFSRTPLVAIPYWELNHPAAAHRLGLRLVDEIWVASKFLADVFGDAGKPVHWIGMSCDARPAPSDTDRQALRARYGLPRKTFVFLTTADALSWAQRKNPQGVVQAFRDAFAGDEDVALLVKTQNLDGPLTTAQQTHWGCIRALCAGDRRITLINESFDAETQRALLAACDCFVSLHRAEGLGLDALDALGLGTSVVATAYSGTLDVCTPDTAWLIPAALRAVAPVDYRFVEPSHVWAEPSPNDAVAAMRGVFFNEDLRAARIRAGQAVASRQAGAAAFAARLEARIRASLGL